MSGANSGASNRESPPGDVAEKQDVLRVQCLLAEIELLKRTISELQFQVQTTQCSTVSTFNSAYNDCPGLAFLLNRYFRI